MTHFNNFLSLESYAYSKAVKHAGNIGVEFVLLQEQGITLTTSEKIWMKQLSNEAVRDLKNQIIDRVILSNHRLSTCRLARLHMSRTKI
jgi:hypothetical protein